MSSKTSAPFASRLLSIAVAASLGAAAFPAAPASAADALDLVVSAKREAPAAESKRVALMRFTGDPSAADLRVEVQSAFDAGGYTVTTVALDVDAAAKRIKCKDEPTSDACLEALGKWLNASDKTAADYIVFGSVDSGPTKQAEIIVYAVEDNKRVKTLRPMMGIGDLILPSVLGPALSRSVEQHANPPAPITAEEQKVLDTLDEPEKTPEEIAAEEQAIADAEKQAEEAAAGEAEQIAEDIEVDLKADFKDFCRTGKRNKRESRDDPKDIRPKCQRGPFWGYWQPRAWVALALTGGAAIGTIAFYSAALAARGSYNDAVDAVDSYVDAAGGDPATDPTVNDGEYVVLATEVSETGAIMRRRAVFGDAFLGATVVLGGVLAIIIWQDRKAAKDYIRQEKALRAVSDVRVGPILTRDTQGIGASFRF